MYNQPTVKNLKDLCNRVYVQKEGEHKKRIKDNRYDNYIVHSMSSHRFYVVLHI